MKRLSYVLVALATIAAPTIASAEDVGVHVGGYSDYRGPRAEYREDRGPRAEYRVYRGRPRAEFYGPRHHDRDVVIRRHHEDY